jgi:hypothetical protein
MSPFEKGDLCYISTKNITFPKGYARKLVPKFIGPYKISEDFGNFSYEVELPTHLKQRGVHDVFHASLLRIHQPNDDRLFPGRLDTQLGNQDSPDGEWAVERIDEHVGSKTDATFKIRWKSGDVTWMPYYQIEHLDALEAYFELLGISKISELPRGTSSNMSQPEDEENFIGTSSTLNDLNISPPLGPSIDSNFASTSSLTLDSISFPTMTTDHSALSHLNLTQLPGDTFTLANPNNPNHLISVTATEIRTYIDYDRKIRDGSISAAEPSGYDTFVGFFNDPAGSCNIRFSVIDRKTGEYSIEGVAPTYRTFRVDVRSTQRAAWMSTGGRPPSRTPSTTASRAHTPDQTPPVQYHPDGSTTYSGQDQVTIARLSLHAATQFLKGKDAAIARRQAKRASPYPTDSAPRRSNDKPKQRGNAQSKRIVATAPAESIRKPDDAMDLDEEDLISEPASPIDPTTGEFTKTIATKDKGKTKVAGSTSTKDVSVVSTSAAGNGGN